MNNNIYKSNTKNIFQNIQNLDKKLKLDKYYELSKILTNLKVFLNDFILLYDSIRNVKERGFVYLDKECYKFIYLDEIVTHIKKDKTTVSKKINILVTLGLIKKLDQNNEYIYSHSTINQTRNKAKTNGTRPVNYYCVPKYTNTLLKHANDIAIKLLQNKFTIKKFNKSFIINVFNQDFANNIFLDKRIIPNKCKVLKKNIKSKLILTIQENQFIKLNDFKKCIIKENTRIKENIISNNIDLVLNELIQEKIIIIRKLTKKEKEIFSIDNKNLCKYILKGINWINE